MTKPAAQPTEPWPHGWSDGFSLDEMKRRAAFFQDEAVKPGLHPLERRGLEVCVSKYEEAIRARAT